MTYRFGERELELGGEYLASDLRESNEILGDGAALRARLDEDGYLLIRRLRPRASVLEIREEILRSMEPAGALLPGSELMDGIIQPGAAGHETTTVRGKDHLRRSEKFQRFIRMPEVMNFFGRMLGGPAGTFDFQWLRIAGAGASSPVHADIVFMGRGTKNLFTCWTPIGDVTLDMGPVVLLQGSHKIEKVRETYGQCDVDRDRIEGWISKDPVEMVERFGGHWSTTEFQAGDVLIFGMYTLHASLANSSNRYRISVDTRYQLASEPFDERWVGEQPPMHYEFWRPGVQLEPVAVSRAKWGF
ncbi:MAG: phytanoyl-CoA dioxygenase family protein [Bryobacterales bacterium]|nr:phytanoyl-CoA dioxygenase family protein [Bryobacterales bacterium]